MQPLEIRATVCALGSIHYEVTGSDIIARDFGLDVLKLIEQKIDEKALAADRTPHIDDRIKGDH